MLACTGCCRHKKYSTPGLPSSSLEEDTFVLLSVPPRTSESSLSIILPYSFLHSLERFTTSPFQQPPALHCTRPATRPPTDTTLLASVGGVLSWKSFRFENTFEYRYCTAYAKSYIPIRVTTVHVITSWKNIASCIELIQLHSAVSKIISWQLFTAILWRLLSLAFTNSLITSYSFRTLKNSSSQQSDLE